MGHRNYCAISKHHCSLKHLHKALAKRNSSQLEPSSQLRWSWVSFGHPLGLSWLELDRVGLNFISSNFRPTRAKFFTVWPPQPTLAKLFCNCYVTTRSYSNNLMVFLRAGSTWRYRLATADASFDFVTWFELAWVGSTIRPGLNGSVLYRIFF